MSSHLPDWRLPRGVTRGAWQYAQSEQVARGYDEEFAANTLFDFDRTVLERYFRKPGLIVDLGAGTGRLLVHFARLGFRGLAVDLSSEMLSIVGQKAEAQRLPIERLKANMVDLECLRDASADYCISMFSSLGMVRGRENRRRVLEHARRILKPEGLLAIHVHNRWANLFHAPGRAWLISNLLDYWRGRDVEPGDKFFDYRDVPKMFLHLYTRRELVAALGEAGFSILKIIPLDTARRHALRWPWLLGRLRANENPI
jgi:SAM-dependent methyltransferase